MTADSFEIRQCPSCRLRYPLIANHPFGERCPSCLGETQVVLKRNLHPFPKVEKAEMRGGFHLSVLLDNIRSVWNVGSIFRTADGLGISKLYLCGITPTPEKDSIRKTSLGAERNVVWEYSRNALETAKRLKADGTILIALEQDVRAKTLETINELSLQNTALMLGNEITGVDPELLDLSDHIIHIPMKGQKSSFNVGVAFAIAAYALRSQMDMSG